jgi:hypothetical protein
MTTLALIGQYILVAAAVAAIEFILVSLFMFLLGL